MSYLDVPRIHFGGLFNTGPATINNLILNYNPKVPLQNSQGQYLPNGDPQPNANLSVLRFQDYTAPADPGWDNAVGPILQAYARLYPGMSQILDIGDETTVEQNAAAIAQRLSLLFLDPALMPVTRDLSPAKVAMIVQWLNSQQGS